MAVNPFQGQATAGAANLAGDSPSGCGFGGDDCAGSGLDYCDGLDFSNMPTPSRPYCVPVMSACTSGHFCSEPPCSPL